MKRRRDPHAHEVKGRVRVIETQIPEGYVPPSTSMRTPPQGGPLIDLTPAAKEDEMTPEEYDQAAVVKPGQTLILRYKQMIPASSADEIKRRLAQRLPGVDVLIIGGVDQILVYGPSESRTAPDQPET